MKATKANLIKIVRKYEKQFPDFDFTVRSQYLVSDKIGSSKFYTYALPYDHAVIEWSGDDVAVDKIDKLLFNADESVFSIIAQRKDGSDVNAHTAWATLFVECRAGIFTHVEPFCPRTA